MLSFQPKVVITVEIRSATLCDQHNATYQYWIPSQQLACRQYILLHSNASNLVLEILKHDKVWGGNLH